MHIRRVQLNSLVLDIRFWIVIFFLISLYGITDPPLEMAHNWRQALTNMIARNFYEGELNLLYPRIDMAGEKSGIIGSEFPFFNFLIYVVSAIFDYQHWYGRIINLITSSIGTFYFYRLLEKLFNRSVAYCASIVLMSSIWFSFSRKIMPDTFSIALVLIGIYYAYEYLQSGKPVKLILFFLFSSLGVLCKIPALTLLSLIAVSVFVRTIPLKRRVLLYFITSISICISALWYFYWVPYLLETYKYQLYFPKGLFEGLLEMKSLIPETLEKFYFSSLHSYIGFLCFLAGLFYILKSNDSLVKLGLSIVSLVFIIFIIKTGSVFPKHSYYIIPYTPIMAFVVGVFLSRIPQKPRYIILFLIVCEGIVNQQHDFFIKDSELYKLTLEQIADQNIGKNDLIVINGGLSPQLIYFANRKGWTIDDESLVNSKEMNNFINKGAKYLVVNRTSFYQKLSYPLKFEDENFSVYRLVTIP